MIIKKLMYKIKKKKYLLINQMINRTKIKKKSKIRV
jgi:hypothetical protein